MALLGTTGLISNPELVRRLREQQRVMHLQAEKLDLMRFQRDVMEDEAKRLRLNAYSGNIPKLDPVHIGDESSEEEEDAAPVDSETEEIKDRLRKNGEEPKAKPKAKPKSAPPPKARSERPPEEVKETTQELNDFL